MTTSDMTPTTTDHEASLANNGTPASLLSTNEILGSPRNLKSFGADLINAFNQVDLNTAGQVLLLTAVALLIYDLLVYLLASTSSRKRLLVTPWLVQVLADSWDDLSQRTAFARSEDSVGPLLRGLAKTAAKYESRWEKSRLL